MTTDKFAVCRLQSAVCLGMTLCFGFALGQIRPIRDVRQNNSQGVPLLAGQSVTVTGRVTVAGQFGGWGPAYVEDATGGVAIYGSAVGGISIGDSVTVTGTVKNFYGLAELDPIASLTNHGAVGTPRPRVEELRFVDRIDTAAGYVENEGWLVRFERIYIQHAPGEKFAGDRNYTINDPTGYSSQMRVDADAPGIVGMTIPDDTVFLVGVIAQYRPNPPHFGGYQVMPRTAADLGIPIEYMKIADAIRDDNGDRRPDRLGQSVTVTGIATAPSGLFNTQYLDIYVQDSTAGVNVFSFNMSAVTLGDSVAVSGKVDLYRGKTEISGATVTVLASGRPLPEPKVLTCSQMNSEAHEGELVKLVGVTCDAGVLQGNQNYEVEDQTGATTLRIDGDTEIPGLSVPQPPLTFDVVGIKGQYANDTVNMDDGYQIMPRYRADFLIEVETLPLRTIAQVQKPGPDGVTPELLDSVVRVRGRVTGPASSFTSGTNKSLYIQDATLGVNLYGCSYPSAQLKFLDSLGVEWEVIGTVTEYNGLTEIANGTMFVTDSSAVPVVPRQLPFNTSLTEAMESYLVTVVGDVAQAAVRSGSGYNVVVKNGSAPITIRIGDNAFPSGIPGFLRTAGKRVRFTGIVGQYDYQAPYTTGYQLLPRFSSDVNDTSGAFPPSERLAIHSIAPSPFSPAKGEVAGIQVNAPTGYRLTVTVFDMQGRPVRVLLSEAQGGFHDLVWDGTDELSRSQPAGIYLVSLKGVKPGGGVETVVQPVVIAARFN